MIVHNLSVPFDRRSWLQCRALREAGHAVSVICPRGSGDAAFERLEGVDIHRYRSREATGGLLAYALEFAIGWLATARLLLRIRRRRRIDVVQACNPPDIYFTLAAVLKLAGAQFVFDQHDLCPELYAARENGGRPAVARALQVLERASQRTADQVIVPNESYRRLAIERGGVDPAAVAVVRNGPDLRAFVPRRPDPALRHGKNHLCCYLGVMGAQDGVDLLVEAIRSVVHTHGVRNCHFALLGYGDRKAAMEAWVAEQGLDPWVTFTGRVGNGEISAYLSTADLGLAPEPSNPFNERSTIVKVMEYMAFGLPVVAFDLPETQVSAGEAGVYVRGGPEGFAAQIVSLLADPAERARRGRIGRARIEQQLSWSHQRQRYLEVMGARLPSSTASGGPRRAEDRSSGPLAGDVGADGRREARRPVAEPW